VIKRLAAGGMAEILLARASGLPGFQKMVVVKRILPELATKSDFVEMFLDEARIAATLQHPNVVQMYDVGVVDRNYFIAMEYLHGEDVRSIMKALTRRDERLPLEHALSILIGVSSGLHYAHDKVGFDGKPLNIVHRDVTPQNIIVTYDGAVKLLDFGIAKASNRVGETRFGTLKGKVPYMSPEQCRGEPLDRRSDIFSLGIMLYELTLGKRLFRGGSDFEILKKIVEGTITPPRFIDPNYDPALERIVLRALEKDKEKRYQTARELQLDLEALVREGRLHVSSIALQGFMERVFGHKIEAWREAQAQGKSLGEHLLAAEAENVLDDEDLEEIDPAEAEQAAQWAKERDAMRRRLEEEAVGMEVPTPASNPSLPPQVGAASLDALRAPRSKAPWLIAGALLTAVAVGAVWKLRPHPVAAPTPPPAPVVVAAPVPVAAPAPEPATPPVPTPLPVGIVKVSTTPPGATLYLDGKKLEGTSPLTLDQIEAEREHVLLVQLEGYKDELQRFTVKTADVEPIDVKLAREAAPPSGHHHHGDATHSRGAEPRASEPAAAAVKLEGEGTLLIATTPWCNVAVDGEDQGPTPLSVVLSAGKHTVTLTNPEFKINRTLPVLILPNETLRKKLEF
jgi:tRNA A-37 threonylcarbamoyl transferase component Bud32